MKTLLKLTLAAAALLIVSGTNQASAQKFGYVDIQELVFSMPEMADVQANYNALQEDLLAQRQAMLDEFNKKRDDYDRNAATLTDGVRQMREKDLTDLAQKLTTFEQETIPGDLQKKQEELLSPLFNKATEAVNTVAKQNGLTAVFAAGAMVYIDEATMVNVLPLAKKHLGIQE